MTFNLFIMLVAQSQSVWAALPLGALAHDGPATPEQISLLLPVTGTLPQTATAGVRYKPTGSSTWITGHPLFRIRPSLTLTPEVGSVPDAFAWPIIDLTPGTSYDVEVTITSSGVSDIKTATFVTRTLPAAAGSPNKTIPAGSSAATIQAAFNGLNPGDVLQFQDGTYNVSSLVLNRSGTAGSPIYIRGQSRGGAVLSNQGRIIQVQDASHVVIENITFRGSGIDSGTNSSSSGIEFYDGSPTQTRITVRNVTMNGVDRGINAFNEIAEFLAYNNTLVGNNTWISSLIDTNATWNDDGINFAGMGNAVFNNTLSGFGDTCALATHSGGSGLTQAIGVHFYRNEILDSGDDACEMDYSHRNITFYDNRIQNAMTFNSLDPLYGGPALLARNIAINIGRTPFKWNSQNSGQFVYNNTIIMTVKGGGSGDVSGWYQPNNGPQQAYGYRNNVMIYRGNGTFTPWIESGGHNPIDFTHNSWFPDKGVQWGPVWNNLASAQAGIANTTPIFSGASKRFSKDNITSSNPFTGAVTLGSDYHTLVTTLYTPVLSAASAPKNSGAVIPNITDGFTGSAPDRGGIIEGRVIPIYGDASGATPPPVVSAPSNPQALDCNNPLPKINLQLSFNSDSSQANLRSSFHNVNDERGEHD